MTHVASLHVENFEAGIKQKPDGEEDGTIAGRATG